MMTRTTVYWVIALGLTAATFAASILVYPILPTPTRPPCTPRATSCRAAPAA